jgi:hypothetical protein
MVHLYLEKIDIVKRYRSGTWIIKSRQFRPLKTRSRLTLELPCSAGQNRRDRVEVPAQLGAVGDYKFAERDSNIKEHVVPGMTVLRGSKVHTQ